MAAANPACLDLKRKSRSHLDIPRAVPLSGEESELAAALCGVGTADRDPVDCVRSGSANFEPELLTNVEVLDERWMFLNGPHIALWSDSKSRRSGCGDPAVFHGALLVWMPLKLQT